MRLFRIRGVLAVAALAFAASFLPPEAHAQASRSRSRADRASASSRVARRPANYNRYGNRGYSNRYAGTAYRGYDGFRPGYGTPVVGGRYVPGYGVIGGGYPGSYPVVGGLYAPGFGAIGTPPTPVVGGSYVPGFGVTGGAAGTQRVQGGTYLPGYGVR